MIIDAQADQITVNTIELQTSGGTPSPLNYYEIYTTSGNTFSGIWASPISAEYTIYKIGGLAVLVIPTGVTATATTAATITASVSIPVRFREGYSIYYNCVIEDNGASKTSLLQINSTGLLKIWGTINSGNFSGTGTSGIYAQSIVIGII